MDIFLRCDTTGFKSFVNTLGADFIPKGQTWNSSNFSSHSKRRNLRCWAWIGIAKYASFRSTEIMKSPLWIKCFTLWIDSILKCSSRIAWLSFFILKTGRNPPEPLGTTNIVEMYSPGQWSTWVMAPFLSIISTSFVQALCFTFDIETCLGTLLWTGGHRKSIWYPWTVWRISGSLVSFLHSAMWSWMAPAYPQRGLFWAIRSRSIPNWSTLALFLSFLDLSYNFHERTEPEGSDWKRMPQDWLL